MSRKIIIPKGSINPKEVSVIEIPENVQGSSVLCLSYTNYAEQARQAADRTLPGNVAYCVPQGDPTPDDFPTWNESDLISPPPSPQAPRAAPPPQICPSKLKRQAPVQKGQAGFMPRPPPRISVQPPTPQGPTDCRCEPPVGLEGPGLEGYEGFKQALPMFDKRAKKGPGRKSSTPMRAPDNRARSSPVRVPRELPQELTRPAKSVRQKLMPWTKQPSKKSPPPKEYDRILKEAMMKEPREVDMLAEDLCLFHQARRKLVFSVAKLANIGTEQQTYLVNPDGSM